MTKKSWRLLDYSSPNPWMNLAIDEAILRERLEEKVPNTFRLWQHPPVVSAGHLVKIDKEVNLELCRKLGVPVIRRLSGGGVLYLDKGSVQCSVICNEDFTAELKDIDKSYRFLSEGILKAFKLLGLEAEYKPINDIMVNGKKVSGSAQQRLYNMLLYHATISVDVDLSFLDRLIRIPAEKLREKGVGNVSDLVTTLRRESGRNIRVEEVKAALIEGYRKTFDVEFEAADLTENERELAAELCKNYKDWSSPSPLKY